MPEFTNFLPIPLPLDSDEKIKGIIVGTPEESKNIAPNANLSYVWWTPKHCIGSSRLYSLGQTIYS